MQVLKDFPAYLISEDGRIFSTRRNKFLRPGLSSEGYPTVSVTREKKKYIRTVHRLLALAFLPNPAGLPQVNHKDGDKKNFSLSNLEWVSASENIQHAYDELGKIGSKTKLTPQQKTCVSSLLAAGVKNRYVSKLFPVSEARVSQIAKEARCKQ